MAVFGAELLAPATIEPHEVAEAALIRVPAVLDEGGIYRLPAIAHFLVQPLNPGHEHQRARIVVDAIAMMPVGHGIDTMLIHARRIAHAEHGGQIGGED